MYGVLFVTLLAFGAKKPLNRTAQWFSCCTSDCEYFLISLAQMGKITRKRQFTDICGSTLFPRTRITDALSKMSRPSVVLLCFVCPLLVLFSLLLVVCNFTVTVQNKLNLCGVLTFEFVCVYVQFMYAKLFRRQI